MSRVNGKQKGNAFERYIANLFQERYGDVWKRVPQSGAIVGGANRASNANLRNDAKEILSSDIIAPIWFPYQIECKAYNDEPKFHAILAGESKILDNWIEQADSDAKFSNKKPIIIFKINRKGIFICINWNYKAYQTNIEPFTYMVYKSKVIMTLESFMVNFLDSEVKYNLDIHNGVSYNANDQNNQ